MTFDRARFAQLRIRERHLQAELDRAKTEQRHDDITPIARSLRLTRDEITKLLEGK